MSQKSLSTTLYKKQQAMSDQNIKTPKDLKKKTHPSMNCYKIQ